MKSKFAASVYLYYAGKCWRNTVPSRSAVTFFNRRHYQISSSFQAQGFECLSKAVHSSALGDDLFSELGPKISALPAKKIKSVTEKPDNIMDDEFSELGPGISESSAKQIQLVNEKTDDFMDGDSSELGSGISESSAKQIQLVTEKTNNFMDGDFSELGSGIPESIMQIKLVTEKPDHFAGIHLHRKELPRQPLSSDKRSNVGEILANIGGASRTLSPKLPDHHHAPTCTDDTRKVSDPERRCSVSVKNIPSKVGLPELVHAISVYGKVSGASFVTASSGLRCCNVEFEDVESSRRASLSGKVTVGSQVFSIDPLAVVDLVAVRIKNINEKTADYEIHSMCKSVGELVGLTRTSKDCVDAFFNVGNHTIHLDIVRKLNNITCNLNRWSAHALKSKSKSPEVPSYKEARRKLGLQMFDGISNLKRQLIMKKIYGEDLEYLNASMMYIEAAGPATNRSANT